MLPDTETPAPSILTQKIGNARTTGEGTDRRVQKKRFTPRRIGMIVLALVIIALIGYAINSSMGGSRLRVAAERLTVSTVELGPFQEYAMVTGNVLPRRTVFLDAIEGGRVEQIHVLEGTEVTAGQPLLTLSNNDLQLRLINADAQRMEQINRVQDTQFRMEQNALDLRQQIAQMDYQIERLEKLHARNEELIAEQLISQQDYDTVHDEYQYYLRTKQLTLAGYRSDSLRMAGQLVRMQESVARMDANYEVIQRILDNLIVRAPISGQLTALNVESIGELHNSGSRFGQIDELAGFKLRAGVDEFYIARVQAGQAATTLPVAGQEYPMRVMRVYPEVQDGRFEVDLEFVQAPPGIRRGQTIRFRLEMSDPAEALLLPKGGFFQTTGGSWIYVLDGSGEAVRRDIRVGRQNPQFLEVMEGLQPGDQVITSSYDSFGDVDRLILN